MPVPQLATASITDRIQALNGQESVPPFVLKAIERDIDRLKAVNAAQAYMLSGMLNAAIGKYEESKDSHQKSLKLSMDVVGLVNYGISLRMLGHMSEAKAIFLQAFERSPGSSDILEKLLRTCTFLCDYIGVEDILSRFARANPDFNVDDIQCMINVKSIISHLEKLEVPRSEFKLVGSFIEQTMLEHDLVSEGLVERLSGFDGVPHIYIEIPLKVKDVSQLISLNERIADLVLGCDELTCWDKLIVNFVDKRSGIISAVA